MKKRQDSKKSIEKAIPLVWDKLGSTRHSKIIQGDMQAPFKI